MYKRQVIGYPSLASAAYDQGRIAAQALVKGEASAHLIEDIPTGIYTIPEISSVGKDVYKRQVMMFTTPPIAPEP